MDKAYKTSLTLTSTRQKTSALPFSLLASSHLCSPQNIFCYVNGYTVGLGNRKSAQTKIQTLLSVLFVVKRDCRDDDFIMVYQKSTMIKISSAKYAASCAVSSYKCVFRGKKSLFSDQIHSLCLFSFFSSLSWVFISTHAITRAERWSKCIPPICMNEWMNMITMSWTLSRT